MHLHIDKECKHSVLLVYIIFTNNRSTKIYFFFSILKTENHIKKNHTHTQKIDHSYREENPSAESTTW